MRYYPAAVKYQLPRLSCLTPEFILGLTTQPPNTTSSEQRPILKKQTLAYVKYFRFQQNMIVDWTTLPELVFSDIMMMVGLHSLESLHRCRQVCRTWNDKILAYIWENPCKRRIIRRRIEMKWGPGMLPSSDDLSHARWLGKYQSILY